LFIEDNLFIPQHYCVIFMHMSKSFSRNFYYIFYLALIIFLVCLFNSALDVNTGDSKSYAYKPSSLSVVSGHVAESGHGRIKVVFPFEKSLSRAYSPFGPGMDEELLTIFLSENQLELSVYYARSYKEALEMLKQKRCDLMVGFGGEPMEDKNSSLAKGPVYASAYPVMVKMSPKNHKGNIYSNLQHSSVADLENSSLLLLDPHAYSVIVPMHSDLRVQGALNEPIGYRWFWDSANIQLDRQLEVFWEDKNNTKLLAELNERYYSFMPKTAKHHDLRALAQIITEKMSLYSEAIAKAADKTGLDPLLIAAVIFQESRFDPEATSYTGVRGLMQLTSDTARMLNVDRLDPEQSILGGARYLRDIRNSLQDLNISEQDIWCLTLAAYNQGPANVRNALRLAEAQGVRQNWLELREVYARLQDSGAASNGFRPREALGYVENVRYYYYVMSRLVTIAGGEEQNLAPLLLLYTPN
jgi:membrane-bound lytic murein transglycosylase F